MSWTESPRSGYRCAMATTARGHIEQTAERVLPGQGLRLVRAKMTERTYYFLGRDGQARLEHYVEHNDSSLSSPA